MVITHQGLGLSARWGVGGGAELFGRWVGDPASSGPLFAGLGVSFYVFYNCETMCM